MPDQTLTCVECSCEFVYTVGEQRHCAEQNWLPPRRCKPCRAAKRARAEADAARDVNAFGHDEGFRNGPR